jgi:hypothetical protein
MKKIVGFLLAILLGCMSTLCQEGTIQRPTLGIHFFFDDFKTAWYIRSSSLRQVFRNRQFGRLKEMSPGLAINYVNGISKHYDFSATLSGAFLDYIRRDGSSFGEDNLLLEGDAAIRGKLFTNDKWVSPYLQLGAGISTYKGRWGLLMPVGTGLQFNLFQEAFLIINAQYRVGITRSVSNHFFYSIGLAGNIGKRRSPPASSLPEE